MVVVVLLLAPASAWAHVMPNLGLMKPQRTVTITSRSIQMRHECRFRVGVLETTATRRVVDTDADGALSERELSEFLATTANHLAMDMTVLASRRGPEETSQSIAPEMLPLVTSSYTPTGPTERPTGFVLVLDGEIPGYLGRPFETTASLQAALALQIIDPTYMVSISGLSDAASESTTDGVVLVNDPALRLLPPPDGPPVAHATEARQPLNAMLMNSIYVARKSGGKARP